MALDISADDFTIVSVKVWNHSSSQTKTSSATRSSPVSQAVSDMLETYLEEHQARQTIVNKVIPLRRPNTLLEKAREMVQRKTVMSGSGLESWPRRTRVSFLVEGDQVEPSKAETATASDRAAQVGTQRGKGHAPQDFRERGIENIYTALGVSWTEEDERALNMTKLRYHKVVIMCDTDVDGATSRP